MFKSVLSLIVTGAAIAVLSIPTVAGGPVTLPDRHFDPGKFRPLPLQCSPDPAITGVTLMKPWAGLHPTHSQGLSSVRIAYIVINAGTAWHDPGRVGGSAFLVVVNGAGNQVYSNRQSFPENAAHGAQMVRFETSTITANFGSDEFVGNIDLSLQYNPDDNNDGNPCNDDVNLSNNHVIIGGQQLLNFLSGTALSQTFHP